MNPQVQFNLSHIIGQAVDVTNYTAFQHHIHGYGNVGTISNLSNHGSTSQAAATQSLAVQNVEMSAGHIPSGSGVVTLGYAQQQQPGPVQSYHAVFNSMTVTHIPPQIQTPQVQYFSYESPCVTLKPSIVPHHVQPMQQVNTQGPPKYDTCPVPFQNVNSGELHNIVASQTETAKESVVEAGEILQNTKKKKKLSLNLKHDRKSRRNRGEAYVNASGKRVEAKCYIDKDCACKMKCILKLGNSCDRETIFKQFWSIGNFSKQNAYISENVTLVPTEGKKRKVPASELEIKNLKTVKRLYHVKLLSADKKVRVCKAMFLSLHGVSNGRLDRVLQAVNCSFPHTLQDRRGHHVPSNKTSEDDVKFVMEHITTIRQNREVVQSSAAGLSVQGIVPNQLPSEMNVNGGQETSIKKMYGSYKQVCKESNRTPVSLWVFRRIGKAKFSQENASNISEPVPNAELLENRMNMMQLPYDNSDSRILTASDMNVYNNNEITADNKIQEIDFNLKSNEVTYESDERRNLEPCKTSMSREERKVKRNSGNSYFTASGKYKDQKCYVDRECGCKYKCIPELGNFEIRKKIFADFWELADFSKQNAYIAEKVVLTPVVQRSGGKLPEKFAKTCSRIYYVKLQEGEDDVRVCKVAFLQLHGVSNGRVDRVLQAVACKSPHALQDRRGHHTPKNKTKDEDIEHASSHIRSFLTELPSDNADGSSRFCLPQDFNIQKMYRFYKELCLRNRRTPVGCFVYRKVLRERYNCYVRSPANKTPEEDLEYAYQHISTFANTFIASQTVLDPGMQSNSVIPPQDSSVKKLHCDYVSKCCEEGRKPVGIDVYRKIFNSKVNLKNP